jgi:hypothetical protein
MSPTARSVSKLCLLSLCLTAPAWAAEPALRLVDDRGQAVADPVSACFQVDLATQCVDVAPGGTVVLPPSFSSVRVEGAHHGPAALRSRDLQPGADGGPPVLQVPRKAFLQVDGLPPASDPLTISVYRPQAPSFRNSLFRAVVGPAGLEIPSGDLVVSLSARGAPDLQRLSAPPASRVKLTYHPRTGWSLIVRCRESAGGGLVAGASVTLYGRSGTTGADGLALLSGIPEGGVASVGHPQYLSQQIGDLAAEAGTFAFREVLLQKGGALSAHVTMDDKPAAGSYCAVLQPDARPGTLAEGTVGADGFCRPGRLPSGDYTLRVSIPQSRSFVDQAFTVRDGADTRIDVPLWSIHVTGRITVGRQPASGYTVEADLLTPTGKTAGTLPALRASTNEYGDYEATVWTAGDYIFRLIADSGSQVAGERRVSLQSPQETVDFELDGTGIGGQVVDEKGQPVEGAQVTLLWDTGDLTTMSGPEGRFVILVSQEGSGDLFAEKNGFESSRPRHVSASRNSGISSVVLVLRRQGGGEEQQPDADGGGR